MSNEKYTAADVLKKVESLKSCFDFLFARDAEEASKETDPYCRGLSDGYLGCEELVSRWLGEILDKFSSVLEEK